MENAKKFYEIARNLGLKLYPCPSCGQWLDVDYYKGLEVRIYCPWGCHILTTKMKDIPADKRSEEELVRTAITNWGAGHVDP